jgi:hypothetical protein
MLTSAQWFTCGICQSSSFAERLGRWRRRLLKMVMMVKVENENDGPSLPHRLIGALKFNIPFLSPLVSSSFVSLWSSRSDGR